jgi:hypothetical protein
LEAIVASTEKATGTIMDAAEEIMSADATSENHVESINDACMRIFEACSFQDITGQRITKVVSTLTYIEERLHGLQDAWGPGIEDADGEVGDPGQDDDARPDKDLLNGPALDGEGILQDQVDDLLNGTADGADPFDFAVETETIATGPAVNPEPSDHGGARPMAKTRTAQMATTRPRGRRKRLAESPYWMTSFHCYRKKKKPPRKPKSMPFLTSPFD